jgi:hypothetical protein
MAVVPDGAPEGVTTTEITAHRPSADEKKHSVTEKNVDIEGISEKADTDSDLGDTTKIYVPGEDEEFIDPRLRNYPIPLVAKTVDLHNDFE